MTVDAERLVSAYLRAQPTINDIVAERVYTDPPANLLFPLVRIQQIGGAPITVPLWLDEALLQIDCYGGPKALARHLLDEVRDLMGSRSFITAHEMGVVTGVDFGDVRYLPDDTFDPAKPRWIFDVSVFTHP